LLDAIGLYHLRWRKKKVDGFIIPANYFYKRVLEIPVASPEIIVAPTVVEEKTVQNDLVSNPVEVQITNPVSEKMLNTATDSQKVSALSLSSIRVKKALQESNKSFVKEEVHLPSEPFNTTDMLLQWNKYAQKLGDKGFRIMESLLLINDPVLNGTAITLELPNEGSKIDFESEKNGLLGHLKGHLHNHDITIEVIVNERLKQSKAFTPQDRYNRLSEINPNLELLRKTFDLDI